MKKCAAALLMLLFLTGCSGKNREMDLGLELRTKLQRSSGYTFDARITADYEEELHRFAVSCRADPQGSVLFTVTEPETISGITGTLSADGGSITFDEAALHIPLLAEGQVTPVSAPWILSSTLLQGYLHSASQDADRILLTFQDSYEEDALQMDVWLDEQNLPQQADVLYDGRRILSIAVKNFEIL